MPQQLDIYRGKGETKIVVSSSFGTLSSPFQRICKYNQFSLLSPPFFPRRIPNCALYFHVFYHGWWCFVCQNLVQCCLNEICHVCFFYHVPDVRKKQGRDSNPHLGLFNRDPYRTYLSARLPIPLPCATKI
jgi:hypothetical protein